MAEKRKFFIGSSGKYRFFADALKEMFDGHAKFQAVYWEDYFKEKGGGKFTVQTLLHAIGEIEFAVFILSNDRQVVSKPEEYISKDIYMATPNVWYEAGMFTAVYGIENVLFVRELTSSGQKPVEFLTDLQGLSPHYYTLSDDVKKTIDDSLQKIIGDGQHSLSWLSFSKDHKSKIKKAFLPIKEAIERGFKERIGGHSTVFHIKDRNDCYAVAERMISEARRFVYTIVSYENEYEDTEHPHGVWPYLEKKIAQMKETLSPAQCRRFFKRCMNLANDKIAAQARYILQEYSDCIEIRDTYCHFIEVIITEKEVLIVLPTSESISCIIGLGVLIKSHAIAHEFADWFNMHIPEPNEFDLSSVTKLDVYRNLPWNMTNMRSEGDNTRCNACFYSVVRNKGRNMPNIYMKQVLEMLEKVRNEGRD